MRRLIAAAVLAWAVAAPAVAQEALPPVMRPMWIEAPPYAQQPSSEGPSELTLNCVVAGNTLSRCAAAEQAPRAFVSAALAAAGAARIDQTDGEGNATEGRPITIGIAFASDAPPPSSSTPAASPSSPTSSASYAAAGTLITSPVWLQRPAARDYAANYPERALQRGINGRVVLECFVEAEGRLNCEVASETPEGQGFGDATLEVSRRFRMAPQTRDGAPTEGGRVRVPVSWRVR